MSEKQIALSLGVKHVNVVLACLQKQPYETVFEVINEIMTQANGQVNKAQAEASKPK